MIIKGYYGPDMSGNAEIRTWDYQVFKLPLSREEMEKIADAKKAWKESQECKE